MKHRCKQSVNRCKLQALRWTSLLTQRNNALWVSKSFKTNKIQNFTGQLRNLDPPTRQVTWSATLLVDRPVSICVSNTSLLLHRQIFTQSAISYFIWAFDRELFTDDRPPNVIVHFCDRIYKKDVQNSKISWQLWKVNHFYSLDVMWQCDHWYETLMISILLIRCCLHTF